VFSNNRVDPTEILYRANERVYITVIGGELGFAGTGCLQVAGRPIAERRVQTEPLPAFHALLARFQARNTPFNLDLRPFKAED
jgi:hypothetical protein